MPAAANVAVVAALVLVLGQLTPVAASGVCGSDPNRVSPSGDGSDCACDEGYELKGKEASDCQNDHQWSAAAPTCEPVPCPQPEREPLLPDQATFKGDKFFFAEGITVKCDVGYEFARFETTAGANRQAETTTRTCQADGTWSGPHPDCHPVFCGGLEAPKFGSMAGKNLNFKGEVTFQCDDGYALVGSASTNCLASAAWSTLAPVCHELPHKVEGVALVGHTDQAAKVTWGGHPKPGLKPIQVYTLFWETADKQLSGQSSTFDASMTAMELEGLPPASDVLISVAAVSDVGTGAKSDPVAQHTCRACLNGGVVDYAYECECACNLPWSGDICEIRDKSLDNYEDGAAKEESASKDEADAAGKDRQAADAVKAQGKADEKKARDDVKDEAKKLGLPDREVDLALQLGAKMKAVKAGADAKKAGKTDTEVSAVIKAEMENDPDAPDYEPKKAELLKAAKAVAEGGVKGDLKFKPMKTV